MLPLRSIFCSQKKVHVCLYRLTLTEIKLIGNSWKTTTQTGSLHFHNDYLNTLFHLASFYGMLLFVVATERE